MTRTIGSVFKYNGCAYTVEEDKSDKWEETCGECVLFGRSCRDFAGVFGECGSTERADKKDVHFKQYGVDW